MTGNYFQAIKQNEKALPEALDYFTQQYEEARKEVKVSGNFGKCVSELSSNFENRLSQLQEIEAILRHFEIKLTQMKSELYKKFLENYQRALSSSDIKVYIEGQPEIVAIQNIINQITLVRNKYVALSKGFETANYQLSNLSRLYGNGTQEVIL